MTDKLGDFIRAHRERIEPAKIGLPATGRRRTPGLRREELAALCGMSSTWLTWLEQGRPVAPSAKMLARLASALQMTKAERSYLFNLAGKVDSEAAGDEARLAFTGQARAIVDVIQAPAYVLDRQWNAIAWNLSASDLFAGWLGADNADADRNLLNYLFLGKDARHFVVDWHDRARRVVAEFRADCGKAVDTPPVKDIVDRLLGQSTDFASLWTAQYVVAREGGLRKFRHATHGEVAYHQISLQSSFPLQGQPELKVTMLLPVS